MTCVFIVRFFSSFHPVCPLFLERRAAVRTYVAEPFLFWAIICIAGRSEIGTILDRVVYDTIMTDTSRLALALSAAEGRSLGSIQGLLLLSEWCFPTVRQKDDRSWHYITVATHAALGMGYHRPYHGYEFTSRVSQQVHHSSLEGRERTLAWLMCHTLNYQ